MSGHCDFCQIWHSGSCSHPGRNEMVALQAQLIEWKNKYADEGHRADCLTLDESRWRDKVAFLTECLAKAEKYAGIEEEKHDEIRERLERSQETIKTAFDCVVEEFNYSNYDHETVCRIGAMWDEALRILDASIEGKD